ncbi:MAG: sensor histidine kinase [Allosphingosinicella sp.]
MKSHDRWVEALRSTIALWLFVLLVFLPVIAERHRYESWGSVALDCSTVFVSMGLAMLMYFASRGTIGLPPYLRLPLRALAVIVTAGVNTVFDLIFQGWIADHVVAAWQTLPDDIARAYSSTLNYILIFGVNMILFHVNYTRRAAVSQERRIAEATTAAQEAQLAALRYQLNPHFLFNALNSISALIVTRRNDDAEAMTDKLSRFLRSSLNADPTALIPLEAELELTEEYLQIESVRFGDRLDVSVDCMPAACSALVPSFLVQPLVENAVKHGVARSSSPVEVLVDADLEGEDLRITVINCVYDAPDDADDLPDAARGGVGLKNVQRRLHAVFGSRASLTAGVENGRFVATIFIPKVPRAN